MLQGARGSFEVRARPGSPEGCRCHPQAGSAGSIGGWQGAPGAALPSALQTSLHTDWTSGRRNEKADGCARVRTPVDAQFGHAATALLSKRLSTKPCTLALPLPRACSHSDPTDSPLFEEDEDFRSFKTSQEKNLQLT